MQTINNYFPDHLTSEGLATLASSTYVAHGPKKKTFSSLVEVDTSTKLSI